MSGFSPRRLLAMMVKETHQILRDPSTLLIAFVLPPILLFLFGYAVNLDTARTRIGLAVLDSSEASRSLTTAFQNSRWFEVTTTGSVAPLKAALVAGPHTRHRRHPAGFRATGRRAAADRSR